MQIDAQQADDRQVVNRVIVQRGVVIDQRQQRTRLVYTIRNNDTVDRTVLVEHPRRVGWTLAAGLDPAETSVTAYRFRVTAPAKQTTSFTVEQVQPLRSEYRVSSLTDDQLNVLIRDSGNGATIQATLRPILEKKAAIATLAAQLGDREGQIQRTSADEQRLRENMRALKDTPEEKRLARRYAGQLIASDDHIDVLRGEQAALQRAIGQARDELAQQIEALAFDVTINQ
jgi:hypothetical protein